MGLSNRAVSHWAAKDTTLSLQGHMSKPQAAWDGDRIRAAITALTAIPSVVWEG